MRRKVPTKREIKKKKQHSLLSSEYEYKYSYKQLWKEYLGNKNNNQWT